MGVWTWIDDGQPYLIKQNLITGAKESTLQASDYREVDLDLSGLSIPGLGGKARLTMGNIQVIGTNHVQSIPFVPISQVSSASEFQKSMPIPVSSDMQYLSLKYCIELEDVTIPTTMPSVSLFGIRLTNGQGMARTLYHYGLQSCMGHNVSIEDSIRVPLGDFTRQTLVLSTSGLHQQLSDNYVLINIRE